MDVFMPVSQQVPLSDRRGLRIKEAAIYLGTSPWWVEIAIREKRIPAYKFKTNYYVLFREDLDAYIERVRANGAA
jgi:excisionase family DNA binding protein